MNIQLPRPLAWIHNLINSHDFGLRWMRMGVLIFACVGLPGCDDAQEAPKNQRSIRLFDSLDSTEWDRIGEAKTPESWRIQESFDDSAWRSRLPWIPSVNVRAKTPATSPVERLLEFGRGGSPGISSIPGMGGALTAIPCRSSDWIEITVWVRAESREALDTPCLVAENLSDEPVWESGSLDYRPLNDAEEVRVLAGPFEETFQELRLIVPPEPGRKGLGIILWPGLRTPACFDDLAIRKLSTLESLSIPRHGDRFKELHHHKITLGESTRDCLAILPGLSVTFPFLPPSVTSTLHFGVGLIGSGGVDDVRLRCLCNDLLIWEETFSASPSEPTRLFTEHAIPLKNLGDQPSELRFESSVQEGCPTVCLAHPVIHRSQTHDDRPNLILISLDTLRADHLSCYGLREEYQSLASTPWLAKAAFTRMSSPHPPTPSRCTSAFSPVKTLWSTECGRLPARIHAQRTPLLAEMLRDDHYACAAFTGGGYVDPRFGFDRGFDRYDTADPLLQTAASHLTSRTRPGENVMEDVTEWIDRPPRTPVSFSSSIPTSSMKYVSQKGLLRSVPR